MKNFILILIGVYALSSCFSSDRPEFLNYNWKNKDRVWIKDGMYNSYTHFDSKTGEMVGDSLIPIEVIDDSLLVITSVKGLGKSDKDFNVILDRDSVFIDTFYYEVRNFNGSKLILFDIKWNLYHVFQIDGEDTKIPDDNYVRYEIAGFAVGDSIPRNLLNFEEVTNYKIRTETASLKANPTIKFEIVGNYYITTIRQQEITEEEFKNVFQEISNKMGKKPEHTPPKQKRNIIAEHYQWKKKGAEITANRIEYTESHILYKHNKKYNDWYISYWDSFFNRFLFSEFANTTNSETRNPTPSATLNTTPLEGLTITSLERLKTTPPGLFSYNVKENAKTDLYIKEGEKINITAKGAMKIGLYTNTVGPNGMSGYEVYSLIKEFPHGCLMATVGDNGPLFQVGERARITADQSGYLKFYINDNNPKNNSGGYQVTCYKL